MQYIGVVRQIYTGGKGAKGEFIPSWFQKDHTAKGPQGSQDWPSYFNCRKKCSWI